MSKITFVMLCLIAVLFSGCGDRFAKEKEAMTKAEKAAMAMELPLVEKPDFSKMPKSTIEERQKIGKKYVEDLHKLIAAEEKILEEMRKSDAQIAELEKKAESDSDKKNLKDFQEKLRKDRVDFVRKISKGRLCGDPFIAGVGSTWQEVEMAYGKPLNAGENLRNAKVYIYDGIIFEDRLYRVVQSLAVRKEWQSTGVAVVSLTGNNITSDAGVKIGMKPEEVENILKGKYVKKSQNSKNGFEFCKITASKSPNKMFYINYYSMKDTEYVNSIFLEFKDGKLIKYNESQI